ncbi:MAG: hypothetical protein QM753_03620 [Thermomicrobiales bacterium]
MNAEHVLLADQRHSGRAARPLNRLSQPLTARSTPKDTTMNTWFLDTDIQLQISEMKRQDMLRNALRKQQLRDTNASASTITNLRFTLANALIALGQAVKPASRAEEWTGSTRTAA